VRSRYGETLLHFAVQDCRDLNLIKFYRSRGVSVLSKTNHGDTPLHALAYSNKNVLEKADALLAGLSDQEIVQLMSAQNSDGATVFDLLRKLKLLCVNQEAAKSLEMHLNGYLNLSRERTAVGGAAIEEQQCSICFDKPNIVNQAQLDSCKHNQFCKSCIASWFAHKNTCPICRSASVLPAERMTGVDE
jgi:ankyrin repeat protein